MIVGPSYSRSLSPKLERELRRAVHEHHLPATTQTQSANGKIIVTCCPAPPRSSTSVKSVAVERVRSILELLIRSSRIVDVHKRIIHCQP